jgi:hypothetical protein
MLNLLDSMVAEIDPEMSAQCATWGGTYTGWQSRVTQLRNFITLRCTALEQGLIDCYSLTGPYATTFDVSPPLSGEIRVNSIWAPTYPWATTYYGGITTNIIAKPLPGFMFDHWEYTTGPLSNVITEDTNSLNITGLENIVAFFIPIFCSVTRLPIIINVLPRVSCWFFPYSNSRKFHHIITANSSSVAPMHNALIAAQSLEE